jgi:hypothetical protein
MPRDILNHQAARYVWLPCVQLQGPYIQVEPKRQRHDDAVIVAVAQTDLAACEQSLPPLLTSISTVFIPCPE